MGIKVFGYGSLMYGSGINGRGMKRKYNDHDVQVAELSGFKRGPYATWKGVGYYGIIESDSNTVVGTVFDISEDDLIPLNKSEGCNLDGTQLDEGSYTLVDVTDLISYKGKGDEKVYTYVIKEILDNIPSIFYFQKVDEKISHLGEDFKTNFLNTTYGVYDGSILGKNND